MAQTLVLLSIPGLRTKDLEHLPAATSLAGGDPTQARIAHSFPCVTWPSQCNVLTGTTAEAHGVVANGFYWRDTGKVEMWTAWNEVIQQPQIWDTLKTTAPQLKTAAWFPMLAKGCQADFVCMPAPIHKPDGSEDMWCHTKPQEYYGELLQQFGHFPLQHFWGPLAGIQSSQWIVDSAIATAKRFQPDFWYIYLPHLDYAAQKEGPDSPRAKLALAELNGTLQQLAEAFTDTYANQLTWMIVSEYVITDVDHVTYPNRLLRAAGLLNVSEAAGKEQLDFAGSQAWALVDHQFSHVFVKDRDPGVIAQIKSMFQSHDGFQLVVSGQDRQSIHLDHPRSGDVILVSTPNSWQAYYWWIDDQRAPDYARTVDIHRKPGYDPVELFFDPATRSVPLDASLVKGSHGAPARETSQQGLFLASRPRLLQSEIVCDTDIHKLVLQSMLQ